MTKGILHRIDSITSTVDFCHVKTEFPFGRFCCCCVSHHRVVSNDHRTVVRAAKTIFQKGYAIQEMYEPPASETRMMAADRDRAARNQADRRRGIFLRHFLDTTRMSRNR